METQLKFLRKKAGYKSAKAFAEKVKMNVYTYTNYEQGKASFTLAQAWEFADVLKCSLDELAGRTWPPDGSIAYSDPRQAELNRCWNATDVARQATVLQVARDAAGASGSGRESDSSQEASPPGVMSA